MIETTFLQLKKLLKNFDNSSCKTKLLLMGDCATQHLATAIKGYSIHSNYPIDVIDTDYNLIDAQILDRARHLTSSPRKGGEMPRTTPTISSQLRSDFGFCRVVFVTRV